MKTHQCRYCEEHMYESRMHRAGGRKNGPVTYMCALCKLTFERGKELSKNSTHNAAFLHGVKAGLRIRLDTDRQKDIKHGNYNKVSLL